MQIQIICKVIGTEKTQKGLMFITDDKFTFEDLILWVYRNCPGDRKITIEQNEIIVQYDERIEIYSIERK